MSDIMSLSDDILKQWDINTKNWECQIKDDYNKEVVQNLVKLAEQIRNNVSYAEKYQ